MDNQSLQQHAEIAVVIPLYNKADRIDKTLQSVLAQSYTSFALFVIDDGSTDGSYEKVIAVSDPRVQVIRQINQGVSAARNRGIAEAKHYRYIAFLDADDYWYPWHLDELIALIKRFPNAGLFSVAHRIKRGDVLLQPRQPFADGFQGIVREPCSAFAVSLSLVHSSTACVNRESVQQTGGFPVGVRNGEDVFFWLKLALDYQLAYSTRFCAEYDQSADQGEKSASLRSDADLPYYLTWLDQQIRQNRLPKSQCRGAKRLLWSGLLYNVAGFRLQGNKRGVSQARNLAIGKTFRGRLLLWLLSRLPGVLFRIARHLRHPKAKKM